jgi:hypothetical protein
VHQGLGSFSGSIPGETPSSQLVCLLSIRVLPFGSSRHFQEHAPKPDGVSFLGGRRGQARLWNYPKKVTKTINSISYKMRGGSVTIPLAPLGAIHQAMVCCRIPGSFDEFTAVQSGSVCGYMQAMGWPLTGRGLVLYVSEKPEREPIFADKMN